MRCVLSAHSAERAGVEEEETNGCMEKTKNLDKFCFSILIIWGMCGDGGVVGLFCSVLFSKTKFSK